MTAEQFDALPAVEQGPQYELLDGELIEVSSASLRHNRIVGLLSYYLNHFLLQNQQGIVAADSEFAIGANRLQPDLAVVSMEKFKRVGEGRSPVRELPDLAIEVASASESAIELERKIAAYLEAGVPEVWAIYPGTRHLFVHTTSGGRLVDRNAVLETSLLPGWSLPLAEIFHD